MAEVQTTPESEGTNVVATKAVETKVADEGSTVVVHEETTVTNGIHNGDAEDTTTDTDGNNLVKVVTGEVKKEEGEEENDDVTNTEEHEVDAVAEDATDTVVEETKEEASPPKVILHQFPPGKEIPSLSPFCLKVETFLKINNIPYENQYGYKMGKKGKLPWIEYDGERKADSKFIIEYLTGKFDVNLDGELSLEQISLGRAITSMLEENTYWALIYNRFVDNFNEYKRYTGQDAGLAFNVSQKMYQRKMRSNLDGHGLGRHSKEEVYKIAENDLKALSATLGTKEFLVGDKISTFDCAVFGLCANILYSGIESPMRNYIKENATNVSDLCDKIKNSYWSGDWLDVVAGEKAEPVLKKSFSFRKKKTNGAKKEAQTEEIEVTVIEKPKDDVPSPSLDEAPTETNTAEEAQTGAETPVPVSEKLAPETPAAAPETPAPETPAAAAEAPAAAAEAPAPAAEAPAQEIPAPAPSHSPEIPVPVPETSTAAVPAETPAGQTSENRTEHVLKTTTEGTAATKEA